MELTERNFEQIGSYVREHLGTWIRDISGPTTTVQLDPAYLERIVRVEEELKSQRELMKQGFDRTERHMNRWMTVVTIVVAAVSAGATFVTAFLVG